MLTMFTSMLKKEDEDEDEEEDEEELDDGNDL